MAEEFLQEVFSYADCISKLEELCYLAYTQDSDNFVIGYNGVVSKIWELGDQKVRDVLTQISSSKDIIYLADQIKEQLLPLLRDLVGELAKIHVALDERYDICSTKSGYLTLYHKGQQRYLHSLDSPMETARLMMKRLYDPEKRTYRVWGIGLGYELLQMAEASCGSIVIEAYEPDPLIYECAKLYGVIGAIPEDYVRYHIGASAEEFLSEINNLQVGYFFHLPSVQVHENAAEKSMLMRQVMYQGAIVMHEKTFPINVRANLNRGLPFVEEFIAEHRAKDVIVVAAGPSLDENMESLRACQGEAMLFAVGTVARKLLKAGITPDAIFVNDPEELTARQFDEIWDAQVPLIADVAVYHLITAAYGGPKYIAWTKVGELFKPALYQKALPSSMASSGTVTGFALHVAIRTADECVFLVGADLAYPTDKSHADGTPLHHSVNHNRMHPVPCNGGGEVDTTDQFDSYRMELEGIIAAHPELLYYNVSCVGAKIKGADLRELIIPRE